MMKNKFFFLLVFVLLFSFGLRAQQVQLITITALENRMKQGRDTTYIINFWATWCKPCVKELPEFEKFKIANAGKPIKVILVSTDLRSKLESGVKPFASSHHLTGEIYLLNEVPSSYYEKIDADWSGALPATLIIYAKKGKKKFHEGAYTYSELTKAVTGN